MADIARRALPAPNGKQPNLSAATFYSRLKNSLSVEQPIAGDELRAIKRYLATREDRLPWLFVSERGAQLTRQAVNYIVKQAGEKAKLAKVWPHMLRHSCGYYLADKGTRPITPASRGIGSRASGSRPRTSPARV